MTEATAAASAPRRALLTPAAVWGTRLAWLLVAVLGGAAVGDALADHAGPAATGLTALAWIGWSIGALALVVPSVPSLTVARVIVPGALVVTVAAGVGGASAGALTALAAPAAVAAVLVGTAELGRRWVQASAYGDEQRFLLRPPLGYLAAAAITWLMWTVVTVVAVVAWSADRWIVALPATALAAAGLVVLPRRWHQLSRRWLVLVPAGVVVHDPVVLAETLMVTRRGLVRLGLGRRGVSGPDGDVVDLTGPTPGVAVVIELREPAVVALATPARARTGGRRRAVDAVVVLVSPSRPGAVLTEARGRRLPVAFCTA